MPYLYSPILQLKRCKLDGNTLGIQLTMPDGIMATNMQTTDVIKLLPDSIANQIAAGEVVQRPASAVKELLENAVDAGATHIQLIIKDGGKTLMQVIDNGCGMTANDALMCFERHATSKIRKAEDLFAIKTMGFRGEAMASIAAVAQVDMRTKQPGQDLGSCIIIEASQLKSQTEISCPEGTSIQIKNLFCNVPARRNFLKSNKIEFKYIFEEFQRIALANPSIKFSLYNDGSELAMLPTAKLSTRIIDMFGKGAAENLAQCQQDIGFLQISGYVGQPASARKMRGDQYFFVNGRFVKSGYLHHSVVSAFSGLIPADTHPFYVLNIGIDAARIDVNVHPTKTEIKFDDERNVYNLLNAVVRKTLSVYNFSPSIDFDADVTLAGFHQSGNATVAPPKTDFGVPTQAILGISNGMHVYPTPIAPQTIPSKIGGGGGPHQKSNLTNWQQLYNTDVDFGKAITSFDNSGDKSEESKSPFRYNDNLLGSRLNQNNNSIVSNPQSLSEGQVNTDAENQFETATERLVGTTFRFALQIHNRYLVAEAPSGLLLINQQGAHERVLFERYHSQNNAKNAAGAQRLLFPVTVHLSIADCALAISLKEDFEAHQLVFEPFGNNTILIQATPPDMPAGQEASTLEYLLEQLKTHNGTSAHAKLTYAERIARNIAKHLSIKAGKSLSQEAAQSLIQQLFSCQMPTYTPDGDPIYTTLSVATLADLIKQNK